MPQDIIVSGDLLIPFLKLYVRSAALLLRTQLRLSMKTKDKRHFKRYRRAVNFALEADHGSYRCDLLDYSLNGVRAIVKDKTSLEKGQVVRIGLKEPLLDFTGEIMWTKGRPDALEVGVRNTGPLRGRLEDFRLADILIGLQRTLSTGVLTFESGDVLKKIYVKNGDMVFASSNQNEDRLGDLLLREGVITREQYDQSVSEMKNTTLRQGAVLVKLGYLSPDALVKAVRDYVEEIIMSLFLFENGTFSFDESQPPTQEVITLKLSAANLIYAGVKKAVAAGNFKEELPSPECRPCFSSNPLDMFQDIELDATGKKMVSLIDGRTSLKDIIALVEIEDFEVTGSLYALMSVRMIELEEADQIHEDIPREFIEETFRNEPCMPMDPKLKKAIESTHEKIESLGYYGILGVGQRASLAQIKTAYYRAAKKYHPDMHFGCPDDSIKDKLSDIFSYVHAAYSTLSHPQKRQKYEEGLSEKPASETAAKDKARAVYQEGKQHLKNDNYHEAESSFRKAAYFDPGVADYHYLLGLTLARQQKQKPAAKAMEAALMIDPYNTTYLAELGFLLLDLGFPKRAKGLFERALSKAPDHARSLEGLGMIGAAEGRRQTIP